MHKNASPKADKSPQTSPEAPFTTFIQLDGRSPVPSQFRTPGTLPQTSSWPHPPFTRFAPMSSISIHSHGAGQAVPSITFTILPLVRDSMTLPRISALAGYVTIAWQCLKTI